MCVCATVDHTLTGGHPLFGRFILPSESLMNTARGQAFMTLRDLSCTFLEALCRSVEDLEWLLLSVDVRSSELQRNILINGDWSPRLRESDGRSYVMPSDLCTVLPLLGSMQPKCQQPKTNIDLGPRSPLELCKRLIGEVVQLRRRPLLGPSPGWKRLLALSHLRHY